MIKVTCKIESYDNPIRPGIKIHAHWNENKMVVLQFGPEEKDSVTVLAKDLIAAITNATNTARF